MSFDLSEYGDVMELRAGRWLVTSRPTGHGDFLLIDDDSVSPLHAIIRITSEGKIQLLDQLSEFGTGVLRVGEEEEEEVSGAMVEVAHGDELRFGKRHFLLCKLPAVRTKPSAGGDKDS